MGTQSEDLKCRRRASRIPMPVEVRLTMNDRAIKAIIRDVSLEENPRDMRIGISLLHNNWLPLNQVLRCHTLSESGLLPSESKCTLTWTLDFGTDGYLSGGWLAGPPSTGAEHTNCGGTA